MAIIEGIAAAKAAFDVSKIALDLLHHPKVDSEAVRGKLLELQNLILSAQQTLGEAQERERTLSEEIRELKRVAEFGADFVFREGLYWKRNYPYCPICWDADRKPVQLIGPKVFGRRQFWECPIHKSEYSANI